MYYHTAFTHRVDWTPEHDAEAEQAMTEIVEDYNSRSDTPMKVDLDTAQDVKARYRKLVTDNPDIDQTPE